MVQEFEGKARLPSQRAAWQSYFKNQTMSWILCNKKNMANVPRTMNEIKIKRQETNKKTIKQISTPSLYVEISQKKNTETVHI